MEVKMKRVVFAFVALAATTATAAAADLARRAPYYPAPGPIYAPVFNWTGFYIGINGGGGRSSTPRAILRRAGPGLCAGLQLDRVLNRHQRRRRLRQFELGFDREPQRQWRSDRRHGRL